MSQEEAYEFVSSLTPKMVEEFANPTGQILTIIETIRENYDVRMARAGLEAYLESKKRGESRSPGYVEIVFAATQRINATRQKRSLDSVRFVTSS